jgi:hypothetical protein
VSHWLAFSIAFRHFCFPIFAFRYFCHFPSNPNYSLQFAAPSFALPLPPFGHSPTANFGGKNFGWFGHLRVGRRRNFGMEKNGERWPRGRYAQQQQQKRTIIERGENNEEGMGKMLRRFELSIILLLPKNNGFLNKF